MTGVLSAEGVDTRIRQQAGLQCKIHFTSNNEGEHDHKTEEWFKLAPSCRDTVKGNLLRTLNSSVQGARHIAAMNIAKLAAIEVPQKQWTDLFSMLCTGIDTGVDGIKCTCLETLGYIFEELNDDSLSQKQTNTILSKVKKQIISPGHFC
jgi:importin subunit beta-1